jgi:hypothetical protein
LGVEFRPVGVGDRVMPKPTKYSGRPYTRHEVGKKYHVRCNIPHNLKLDFIARLTHGEYEMNGVTPRLWFDNGVYISGDLIQLERLEDDASIF